MILTALSFYGLFTACLLCEEVMLVRLFVKYILILIYNYQKDASEVGTGGVSIKVAFMSL